MRILKTNSFAGILGITNWIWNMRVSFNPVVIVELECKKNTSLPLSPLLVFRETHLQNQNRQMSIELFQDCFFLNRHALIKAPRENNAQFKTEIYFLSNANWKYNTKPRTQRLVNWYVYWNSESSETWNYGTPQWHGTMYNISIKYSINECGPFLSFSVSILVPPAWINVLKGVY